MATQRLTVATFAGESAVAVAALIRSWRTCPDPAAVDRFCGALRENGSSLPIVYFCEWVDRWLMGDQVPGPGDVSGQRYEATCFTRSEAMAWAARCGNQWPEQQWLATRLREGASASSGLADRVVIVVVREVLGSSTTDEEVQASLGVVPGWLSGSFTGEAES